LRAGASVKTGSLGQIRLTGRRLNLDFKDLIFHSTIPCDRPDASHESPDPERDMRNGCGCAEQFARIVSTSRSRRFFLNCFFVAIVRACLYNRCVPVAYPLGNVARKVALCLSKHEFVRAISYPGEIHHDVAPAAKLHAVPP
jgi:hypothetical protein